MYRDVAMKLHQQIERAFGHRIKPGTVVDVLVPNMPDIEDALWFSGRDWRSISVEDWDQHPDAIYFFNPEAFAYYIPSVLSLTSGGNAGWTMVADSLLISLDRSPGVANWDNFITRNLVGLTIDEYEAIQAWLLSLSDSNRVWEENGLTRAYETVELLKSESEKLFRQADAQDENLKRQHPR